MPKAKPIDFTINERGCFICISHVTNKWGYCYYRRGGGKRYYLHRYVYEQCFGEIPEGLVVRHTCDNATCINPEHLILGTDADNNRDMIERGRINPLRGECCIFAKLTTDQILQIRADKMHGNRELAKVYGVSHGNISAIRLGKSWKHIIEAEG